MDNPQLSVILPTFNRWNALLKSLSALRKQTLEPSSYEVIVVDDGSTDDSYKNNLKGIGIQNLIYLHQDKKGPASARNLGIRNAKGEILLFIGDDIIASDNLLEEHLIFHRKKFQEENSACLGYITWPVDFKQSTFLDFMENWGQFLFGNLRHGEELNYNYFYSSNISLKKYFLFSKNLFFDEDFKYAVWEDIEFGYRLEKEGLRIVFNRNAIAFHNHYQTMESAINRTKISGESLFLLLKKLPELSKEFGFLKTEKGFILRHRLIKNIVRNKLSVAVMIGLLKLFKSIPLSSSLQNGDLERFLYIKKTQNWLLKEIYKNILLYHLQKNFEKAQKNCQI